MVLVRVWRDKQYALRAAAYAVLGDQSQVDDVLQEALLRILENGRDFKSDKEAFLYLRKTVLHASIDSYRKIQKNSERLNDPGTRQACRYSQADQLEDPLAQLLLKEEKEDSRQLGEIVKAAMRNLTSKQKEAIEIFFFRRGKKLQDLCKENGVPYSTLRSRMLKGIDRIRDYLSQEGLEGFGNKTENQKVKLHDGEMRRSKTHRIASR